VDQIFDRFERMFRSWANGTAAEVESLFGAPGASRRPSGPGRTTGDPDLDEAMAELDDFLDMGRTETEARQRASERASERTEERRAREDAARSRGSYGGASDSRFSGGPPAAIVQAYRMLGLAYGTPFPQVKAAYKRLLMQNHPDRNSATPEQLKRSTEISAQINAAYQRIETWTTTGKLDEN
jgi:DnaJ-domain-containing protein 1